jgi:hypothetical protein
MHKIAKRAGLHHKKTGFQRFSDKPPWLAATTRDENTHLQSVRLINVV